MKSVNEFKISITIGIFVIFATSNDYSRVNGQTCDPNCQRGIDQAFAQSNDHHTKLTQVTDALSTRILKLENEEVGVLDEVNLLAGRISRLQSHLAGNVSILQDEINSIWKDVNDNMNKMKADLNKRIDDLTKKVNDHHPPRGTTATTPRPGNNNGGSATDVYLNLTRRIDILEFNKIFNLTTDNSIWRRNFRIINSTFNRIRNCNCR